MSEVSESTALVPLKREPPVFSEDLPEDCRIFLELFVKTRTISDAAQLMGKSRDCHRRWMGRRPKHGLEVPGFEEAFEVALEDVRQQEFDRLGELVEKGLKEEMYDADGNLKHTRYRQSEGLIKLRLQALDPERYVPDKGGGSPNVVIVLNETREGGWEE